METHYIIDSGNTNLKVSEFSPTGEIKKKYYISSLDDLNINESSKALFCSVNEILNNEQPNIIDFNTIKNSLDFKTDYSKTLGNDRMALVYGISKLFNDDTFVAVDAGSFITIDIVNDGKHRGGFIYPGLQTFLKSYDLHGKNLPKLESIEMATKSIATNTDEAIAIAASFYIESVKKHILSFEIENIYLTGGDLELFEIGSAKKDKDLLEKALHSILLENIN